MDLACQNSGLNIRHLLNQLNTARKEINNLRSQLKSLKYVHEKDVENIKQILELHMNNESSSEQRLIAQEEAKPSTSADDDILKLKPIGVISTWFPRKRGTPRQPGICEKAPGKIVLHNSIFTNPEHALDGLQGFSHMWILFYFHKNEAKHVRAKVAPPRLNGTRIGVFSTRSPHRPCPIGLSLVKIIKIENHTIFFEGVDMVDQTPVLDIKPYIPVYDNPTSTEMLNAYADCNINNAETQEIAEQTYSNSTGRNFRLNPINVDVDSDDDFNNLFQNSHRSRTNETIHNVDVSRDEEIALRLQTEEFQSQTNLNNFDDTGNSLPLNNISISIQNGTQNDIGQVPNIASNLELQTQDLNSLNYRVQDLNFDERNGSQVVHSLMDDTESRVPRNSRLLDGADGPSTVCGTDLDLINRRALNSRVDNSPIRMGVREAPDGEEGYESQTLSNTQTVRNISNTESTINNEVTLLSTTEIRNSLRVEHNLSEVRVPDWISRPRINTLSVIFNERAWIQLNDIMEDKAEEQKSAIESVLREDPRSVYLRQRWGNQFYTFLIHDLHITCRFDDSRSIVTVLQIRHAGRICECGEPEWQCLGHSPIS